MDSFTYLPAICRYAGMIWDKVKVTLLHLHFLFKNNLSGNKQLSRYEKCKVLAIKVGE